MYVAINMFSKWIEYKPLVSATAKKAVELFEDIIHRFDLLNSIIPTLELHLLVIIFGTSMKTDASPSNTSLLPILEPMARVNGMILDALKKRLYQKEEKHPGRWLKELIAVV